MVIVSGAPCTGKTAIGTAIADVLGYPLIIKDTFKEILFDTLGWSDRQWSKKLGLASFQLMFVVLESHLKAGQPLVLETAFHRETDIPKFLDLRRKYEFDVFEVHCVTAPDVLRARWQARADSGERHPGHVEKLSTDIKPRLTDATWEALAIGAVITVDTTDWVRVDTNAVVDEVKRSIAALGY